MSLFEYDKSTWYHHKGTKNDIRNVSGNMNIQMVQNTCLLGRLKSASEEGQASVRNDIAVI